MEVIINKDEKNIEKSPRKGLKESELPYWAAKKDQYGKREKPYTAGMSHFNL